MGDMEPSGRTEQFRVRIRCKREPGAGSPCSVGVEVPHLGSPLFSCCLCELGAVQPHKLLFNDPFLAGQLRALLAAGERC